jgi:hypothetical protein
VQDYFAPLPGAGPARPEAPPGGPPVTAGPLPHPAADSGGRRRRRLLTGLLLVTAASLVAVGLQARVSPPPELRQATGPAPASAGWGASWVDDQGRIGRWDPCAPIRYVVNPTWAPPQGRADLGEALRRLSAATGLEFLDEGDTDEMPSRARAAYQRERYGDRWAPLLIGWATPSTTDVGIGGGTKGVALTVAVPGQAGPSLLTGQVVLDAEQRLPAGFGPGSTEGEVLLHELAHAVGLGHVDDPTQVMYYRTTNNESEFGAGDRAGLTALGTAAGCHPAPAPGPLRTAS